MKKIYYLMLLLVAAVSFTSCNDDTDNPYERTSQLKVLRSSVLFDSKGGTGFVKFEAPSAITATLNSSWATATVQGDSVRVVATANEAYEGRASVLTVRCGEDSVQLTVQQLGMVVSINVDSSIVVGDEASKVGYRISTSNKVTFTSSADWLTGTATNDSLFINYGKNATGSIRTGVLHYQCGNLKDSIVVTQGALADITNKQYLLGGKNYFKEGNPLIAYVAKIVDKKGKLFLEIPSFNWSIPVTFNASTLSISLTSGNLIGRLKIKETDAYVFMLMFNHQDLKSTIVLDNSATMTGAFNVIPEVGTMCLFEGSKGSTGATFDTMLFSGFKTDKLSTEDYIGNIIGLIDPLLQEYTPTAAKASQAPKHILRASEANGNDWKIIR